MSINRRGLFLGQGGTPYTTDETPDCSHQQPQNQTTENKRRYWQPPFIGGFAPAT